MQSENECNEFQRKPKQHGKYVFRLPMPSNPAFPNINDAVRRVVLPRTVAPMANLSEAA